MQHGHTVEGEGLMKGGWAKNNVGGVGSQASAIVGWGGEDWKKSPQPESKGEVGGGGVKGRWRSPLPQ